MTRIARLEGVKARVAPILYMEGACGVRLKADDDVSEIFKNGRASISLGYIGIHETINALYGNQHMYDSEALREKGVAIVQRLRDAVDVWKEETGYGFSLSQHAEREPVRPLLPSRHRRVWHSGGRDR